MTLPTFVSIIIVSTIQFCNGCIDYCVLAAAHGSSGYPTGTVKINPYVNLENKLYPYQILSKYVQPFLRA